MKKFMLIIFILIVAITVFGRFVKTEDEIKEEVKMPVVNQKENEEVKEVEAVESVEKIEKQIEKETEKEVEEEVVVKKEDVEKEVIDSREIKKPKNQGGEEVDHSKKDKLKVKEEVIEEIEVTEEEIIEKYTKQFGDLSGEFEGKVASLLGEAKAEYNALSEEKKKSEKISLGLKYLKKGKALEKECDGRFDGILGEMKKELGDHRYSLNAAIAAKAEYKKQKSARRKALMKKALGK